jgi:hypothetical protein
MLCDESSDGGLKHSAESGKICDGRTFHHDGPSICCDETKEHDLDDLGSTRHSMSSAVTCLSSF